MKILLLEYITAGGFNDVPLPVSMLREGLLIRDALLRDFSQLSAVEIVTTYDARVGIENACNIQSHIIDTHMHATQVWQTLLTSCDAALIVAPETDGILYRLTQMVEASAAINLGCDAKSVQLTSSKLATYSALQQAGISTIHSDRAEAFLAKIVPPAYPNGYVVKPDDGAGCDQTRYFASQAALTAWLKSQADVMSNYIVQPYQIGQAASFSMLCKQGKAWLLACNGQKVVIDQASDRRFKYTGSQINALTQYHARFNQLAQAIAVAIPGLNGYVGVDIIIDEHAIYVVEINPRITTSYIGLQESLQYNPASLILSADMEQDFILPAGLTAMPVEVNVYA